MHNNCACTNHSSKSLKVKVKSTIIKVLTWAAGGGLVFAFFADRIMHLLGIGCLGF